MMIFKLLSQLRNLKVKLWIEDDRLRVKAPQGALTAAMRKELGENKEEILRFLRKAGDKGTGVHAPLEDAFPITPAQRSMWLIEQIYGPNPFGHTSLALKLIGDLKKDLLVQALTAVSERHETLRTVFKNDAGMPRPVIREKTRIVWKTVNLKDIPVMERDVRLNQHLHDTSGRAFELGDGPLFRCSLFKMDEEEHVLLVDAHHMIIDDTGLRTVVGEALTAYDALAFGKEVNFAEESTPFSEYARDQHNWLQGDSCREQMEFWKDQVEELPSFELVTDHPRPELYSFEGGITRFDLSRDQMDALKGILPNDASLPEGLLAVFKLLLFRYSGHGHVVIGVKSSSDMEGAPGPRDNYRIVASDLNNCNNFGEVLERVHNDYVKTDRFAVLPFELLVEEHFGQPELNRHPLFQVGYAYEMAWNCPKKSGGLDVQALDYDHGVSELDLSLVLVETDTGIRGSLEYRRDLFKCETIERLSSHFLQLLDQVTKDTGKTLSAYDFIGEDEKQLLMKFGRNLSDHPQNQTCVPHLVDQQAEQDPHAFAVIHGRDRWTYEELSKTSNQLAAHLLNQGATKGAPIAIVMKPSFDMMVAMLGVLKTGAPFLPLSPANPRKRLETILADAKVSAVITESVLLDSLPDTDSAIVCMDRDREMLTKLPNESTNVKIGRDNLYSVTYCSDDHGRPIGVLTSHGTMTDLLDNFIESNGMDCGDRMLQLSLLGMSSGFWNLFAGLIVGAQIHLLDEENRAYDERLVDEIVDREITLLMLGPAKLRHLLDTPGIGRCTSLRQVISGGDSLSRGITARFNGRLPHVKLYNLYGMSESPVSAMFPVEGKIVTPRVPIGKPVKKVNLHVLDDHLRHVPIGVAGHLYVGGANLAEGYLNQPDLYNERFITDPFGAEGDRLFKTGDRARFLADGNLEILGREDRLVKINGNRVNLSEIEQTLIDYPEISEAVVTSQRVHDEMKLCAFFISKTTDAVDNNALYVYLKELLPDYMVPGILRHMDNLTRDKKGELMAISLESNDSMGEAEAYPRSFSEVEQAIAQSWKEVLEVEKIGVAENFFDIGGRPIDLVQVYYRLPELLRQDLCVADLFLHPTIYSLGLYLEHKEDKALAFDKGEHEQKLRKVRDSVDDTPGINIAIVGMSGRFPGANNIEQFWQNLREGVESISFFSKEELEKEGVDSELLDDPDYVRARASLDDYKSFDAGFFDFTPREAQITDPQHRLLLECSWEALERAGYAPSKYGGDIGVFAGCGENYYLAYHIRPKPQLEETVGALPIMIGNDKDNLSTRISFKLGLTGPSMAIQSACSTSLVAIHTACRSLRGGDCDLAIAGGCTLADLRKSGYLYEVGMIAPPDGHCRVFDANGQGTVPGQGAGVILLKRLEDALADGDQIYAVIRGSAVNNDGSDKNGYTGYGVNGQTRVIKAAQQSAQIEPDSVSYIETSSSGSKLGDPIELESLTRAFREGGSSRAHFCAIGAIKPNIGGIDTASGVAAIVKLALALYHRELPPTINHETPNPKIDFENGPFFVNVERRNWDTRKLPRRAGINAFGLGGTNAHLVLEEPPPRLPGSKGCPWQLLTLSAKTHGALETMTRDLITHFKRHSHLNFPDVAYTLHLGRDDFRYRRMLVCQNLHEAVLELEKPNLQRVFTKNQEATARPIAFMFPGQGAQYMNMGHQLYQQLPAYRREVDHCWAIVRKQSPELYASLSERDRGGRSEKLHQTFVTQPATFIAEYALARLLIGWGIQPEAMIGNSLGEYVAACIAGVFSLKDALTAVVMRGELQQTIPGGVQMAVQLSEKEIQPYLHDQLSLAGVGGPNQCMIAGSKKSINELRDKLTAKGIGTQRLFSSHAFHSYMMDPILPKFAEAIGKLQLNPPKIRFISSVTGTWITDEEATDPRYWARQMRLPVRFSQGLDLLYQEPERVLLEVGPEKTLSSIALHHPAKEKDHIVLSTMRQPLEEDGDVQHLFTALGRMWLSGVSIDWNQFHADEFRHRVLLPTYPFEKQNHWIDPPKHAAAYFDGQDLEPDEMEEDFDDGDDFYRPNVSTAYEGPRDAEEKIIADIWHRFLGLETIGIHDDFFELGGNSLVAVRLINQLGKEFQIPLPSHILLQKRTIATLAELIKQNSATPELLKSGSPLVEIQRGSAKVLPLFMAHPIGGEVYFYRDLAHYLGSQRPVFGFQAQSLTGKVEPFRDLKAQAASYVDALLEFRPKGPYLLGGSSYGGNLVYEMAQQLFKKGHEVPLLVVIDSPAPGHMPGKLDDTAAILDYLLADKLPINVHELRELNVDEQMSYILEKARAANRSDVLPPTFGRAMFETWLAHQEAMNAYVPEKYPGRVIFFRPTEHMKINPSTMYMPWIDLVTGGIEIHQVPGNHITMNFDPNVKEIIKHLKRALRKL